MTEKDRVFGFRSQILTHQHIVTLAFARDFARINVDFVNDFSVLGNELFFWIKISFILLCRFCNPDNV